MAVINYVLDMSHDNVHGVDVMEAAAVVKSNGELHILLAADRRKGPRVAHVYSQDGSPEIAAKLTVFRDTEFGGSWLRIETEKNTCIINRISKLAASKKSNGFAVKAINIFAGRQIIVLDGETKQDGVLKAVAEKRDHQFIKMALKDAVRHERNLH